MTQLTETETLFRQQHQDVVWRHCKKCTSQRPGLKCWKCGGDTTVPHIDWEYPQLPSVDRIRELAKEVGYAIGVHGSMERDLDVIAMPWREDAVSATELLDHISKGLNAKIVSTETKPLGRFSANIQIIGFYKIIDISVGPRQTS